MNRLVNRRLMLVNLLVTFAISLVINSSQLFTWAQSSEPFPRFHHGQSVGEDYASLTTLFLIQLLYYTAVGFGLMCVFLNKINRDNYKFWDRFILCLALSFVFYELSPLIGRNDNLYLTFLSRRIFNPVQALKSTFVLSVISLYVVIYRLYLKQEYILIENERLNSENLEARYDMLVSQFNPHFFFNSLNSLSMLVRTENKSQAIKYIDHLSDTFRYILKNSKQGMVTLEEELAFTESYKYLHEIRYSDKLFIDINIDNRLYDSALPSVSLQPLIENAVKHNVVTSEQNLTIYIYSEGDCVCVKNKINKKTEKINTLGIGLENMSSRYKLLTDMDIEVIDDENNFTVKLPLCIKS